MARAILQLYACVLLCFFTSAENPPANDIHALLDMQVAAWNRGDMEGYMSGYWQSPDLTFFSAAKEYKGWDSALARYKKAYLGNGREMGQLSFDNLRIEMLADDAALVRGAWSLRMRNGTNPHGLFTLIVRKTDQGWRIIHDHSS